MSQLGTILGDRILGIWAHPDDETYLCGGLMARAVQSGARVVCVTATRGELGSTDPDRWPAGAALAEVRTRELEDALGRLGVTEHRAGRYAARGAVDPPDPGGTMANVNPIPAGSGV